MPGTSRNRSPRTLVALLGALVAATVVARKAGYKVGGNVIVRCREGHLFTTLWIPGVKLKALDLGLVRIQHCPVGHHWTVVVPVRDRDLSDDQRVAAARRHDIRLP